MSTEPQKQNVRKTILMGLTVLVFIGLASAAGYFFWQYRQLSSASAEAEQKRVVSAVSKHMQLPEETPSVATVTDKEKLKEQGFFKNAENGDKVLIYVENQRAILYRPSINRIIDIAPVRTVEGTEQTQSDSPQPSSSPQSQNQNRKTVAVYNGTTTPGLASKVEDVITDKNLSFEISTRQNASVETYTESIVVDLKGTNSADAQQLAQAVGAQVQPLPAGETRPNTDLLVILGSDFD